MGRKRKHSDSESEDDKENRLERKMKRLLRKMKKHKKNRRVKVRHGKRPRARDSHSREVTPRESDSESHSGSKDSPQDQHQRSMPQDSRGSLPREDPAPPVQRVESYSPLNGIEVENSSIVPPSGGSHDDVGQQKPAGDGSSASSHPDSVDNTISVQAEVHATDQGQQTGFRNPGGNWQSSSP
ncbi:uncharacterized protein LOC135171232 [Diachasmimorpha longicaudata]|uniref:uncharacterized protein LOC135171232 n=1 Tax=Diachasmimorpha longicaudata TaxID=58733 RepID=UPI0030B8A4BE